MEATRTVFLRLSEKPLCQCGTNNAYSWEQECLLIAPKMLAHGAKSAYSWDQKCLLIVPRVLTHATKSTYS